MNWIYAEKEVPSSKPTFYGFVYLIEFTDSSMYVGKKQFYSVVTKTPLKSGINREGGTFFNKIVNRKVTQLESVKSENNWRSYNGSSKKTKTLKIKKKTMLQVYPDKLNLTFGELEWMIKLDVLRNKMYHNDNILGKFYDGKIVEEVIIKE